MLNNENTATTALRAIPTKYLTLEDWKTLCGAARCAGVGYGAFYVWTGDIPEATTQAWGVSDYLDEDRPDAGPDVALGWERLPDAEVGVLYTMADRAGSWPGHWRADRGLSDVLDLAQQYDPSGHWFLDDKPGLPRGNLGILPNQCRVRVGGHDAGGFLAVPMRDADGELSNIHLIPPPSISDMNAGIFSVKAVPLLDDAGGWFGLGEPTADGVIYVCESLESAWACRRATGAASVVSSLPFDSEDCDIVGGLRAAHPNAPLVLVPAPRTAEFAHDLADGHQAVCVLNFTKEDPDFTAYAMLKRDGRATLKKLLEQAVPVAVAGPRFELLSGCDLAATAPSLWAVNGVLPTTGLAAIFGASGVGKSFLALDAVTAIAEGRPWFGHTTSPRPITYAVLEGQAGFKYRVASWEQHHGRKLPQSIRSMMAGFNITSEQDVTEFAAVLPKGGILVIDTLNAAAPGVDENGSVGMGSILAGAKRLASVTGGLVLLIHHSGKSESAGLRGHSSLISALDAAVFVTRKAGRGAWTTDIARGGKCKDGAGVTHQFALDTVTLPDGTTSCIVDAGTSPTETAMAPRLRDALAAFERVAVPDGAGVSLDDWRAEFYATSTATNTHAKKVAFQRARDDLVSAGHLLLVDDVYHLTPAKAGDISE
ncbi:MAG: AAA family ATPase [Rhodoferax sp.]|uniref:AAA family ATPase n=1 Tax=Rhodoferax sp. TaxID=50421 RepID=UPI0017DAFE49|nr:AAA family ATPase [Rhodoferax sp.]NMM19126.1 AAA family ATPase [Rhodoferax sp.]